MKIILELEIIQSPNDKNSIERVIEKYFKYGCDVFNGQITYYRNLGNNYGGPDLIVKLNKLDINESI